MADNNYCACNSGESKYTIKLNQQGPAGKKGEQGDKGLPGFSPYISVVQSDDENYILRINNEANSYNTPNLFPKDQLVTWTNNIEAQVQQNTTDLSKINGNYVTLNGSETINGFKTFSNSLTVGVKESSLGFKYTNIRLVPNLYDVISKIVFHNPNSNPDKPDTFLSYHKDVGICYYKNQFDESSLAGESNELVIKADLKQYDTRLGSLESTVGEQAQTIATLQENNTQLLEMINTLKDRVIALETMIDGGNA